MITSKILNTELLSFYNHGVGGVSQKGRDLMVDSLRVSISAELYNVRTSACKNLLQILKTTFVKVTFFQVLQRRASSSGLSLSAFVDSTMRKESERKRIKLQ